MARVYNFSAGPSMLPLEVLETAQKERYGDESSFTCLRCNNQRD